MAGFVPNGRAFRPARQGEGDVEVFEAAIEASIIIPGILPNVKGKILSLSKIQIKRHECMFVPLAIIVMKPIGSSTQP
jgi:hypothetical protein